MQINWKKGFNRLFIVAALGWAIYVFWYLPIQQWHERFDMALDSWTLCLSSATQPKGKTQVEQCNPEHQKALNDIPHSAWTGFGWDGWLLGIAAIPPLIVYLLLRALGWTSIWIRRGFEPSSPKLRDSFGCGAGRLAFQAP